MNDLFLCHTGVDKEWTEQLGIRLEQNQIAGRPIKVFLDKWDIDYGANIIAEIDKGLKDSRYVGLVLSPAMVKADWPTAEWQSQVMDDPAEKKGRILPILLHKFDPETGAPIELPFALKMLKRFDFSDPKRVEGEFQSLLRKLANLPPIRGPQVHGRRALGSAITASFPGQESPDVLEESLPSNLFRAIDVPLSIYGASTVVTTKREVWDRLKGSPPFFLYSDKLYSFIPSEISKNPFKQFFQGNPSPPESTSEWLADSDKSRQIIGILNAALREHCYDLSIWTPKGDRGLFYPPISADSVPRTFTWGVGKSRTLAKMHQSTKQGGASFGVHMAARMRFVNLTGNLYLLIEPAWMFTTDGVKPVQGADMGVFSTKWGGREKNAAVLRNVLMWGFILANKKKDIEINVGSRKEKAYVKVRPVPSHTKINVGIFGDTIRLDRILSGEGAGEERESAKGADELDRIANLALTGEPAEDEDAASEERKEGEDEDGEEELEFQF